MSRFDKRLKESLKDPQHRASYFAADAEAQLTSALNVARKELGISQRELGERLDKSQAAVSQFLNAEDGITIERLVEYLLALHLEAQIEIRRTFADPPVQVGLDLRHPSDYVFDIAQEFFLAEVKKNPPRNAGFGGLRAVEDDEDQPMAQSGAA